MSVKIGIVDDQINNRVILRKKLLKHDFLITVEAANGKEFLDKIYLLPEDRMPGIVLMDLEMPQMDGVEAIAIGSNLYPNIKFIVLTIFDDEEKIFNAIKAGAFGYLLKDENDENIANMLLQMLENGIGPISPGIAYKILQLVQTGQMSIQNKILSPNTNFNLTNREIEILDLLSAGLLYKEIADTLNISRNTAKKHILNIYEKLHVNSRTQAINIVHKLKN